MFWRFNLNPKVLNASLDIVHDVAVLSIAPRLIGFRGTLHLACKQAPARQGVSADDHVANNSCERCLKLFGRDGVAADITRLSPWPVSSC